MCKRECVECGYAFEADSDWSTLCRECEYATECEFEQDSYEEDQFRDDVEADADALRSAGWGTDEDYYVEPYDCDLWNEW